MASLRMVDQERTHSRAGSFFCGPPAVLVHARHAEQDPWPMRLLRRVLQRKVHAGRRAACAWLLFERSLPPFLRQQVGETEEVDAAAAPICRQHPGSAATTSATSPATAACFASCASIPTGPAACDGGCFNADHRSRDRNARQRCKQQQRQHSAPCCMSFLQLKQSIRFCD